eukprot:CAMPEP_0113487388 /NCGR_PEP_ID=MMETSP0014_2-20120614/25483_1 /TAXON_ID=2857 /ORGANISM="Nitzschia sp." /LENGTH=1125 /DNA_ID=CAMNT_0000381083 /DNA_START=125 /DNA_END=3502 /DNA_ORIENTATION=+ /assembly_acc=CAM_ASM_000159
MKFVLPLVVLQSLLLVQHPVASQEAADPAERQLDAGFQLQVPTDAPTEEPTVAPTPAPTRGPTKAPTRRPTREPTRPPTFSDGGVDTSGLGASQIAPLCGTQSDSFGEPISNSSAYDNYNYETIGKTGNLFSRGYLSGRVAFYVSRSCRYHMRDQEYNYYDVSGINEFFQAGAALMEGKELVDDEDPARFTGFGTPWESDIVKKYTPCASGKYCTAVKYNAANPILTKTKVFEFDSDWRRGEMWRLLHDTVKDREAWQIYGTNSHLKCGVPPFCKSPGRGGRGATCYVDPIGWYQPEQQCEAYQFMIDYAPGAEPASSVSGTKDVWPWFNECCSSFKCERAYTRGNFPYKDVSVRKGEYSNGTWYFRMSGSGSDLRWNCENQLEAELMYDFALSVQASKLTHQKDLGDCEPKPEIPPVLLEPTPAPTYAPGVECTPEMQSIEPKPLTIAGQNVNQHSSRPFGYCDGETAKAYVGTPVCGGELHFYLETPEETTGYTSVIEWFDASIGSMFGCTMEDPTDLERFTYIGRPHYGVRSEVKNGERTYQFYLSNRHIKIDGTKHNSIEGKNAKGKGHINWNCPSGKAAYDARSHMWSTSSRNWNAGNHFGDFWKVANVECTDAPSSAPVLTEAPTITASPTGTPTMFPTYCQDSYLDSESLNIALVVDLSYSTYKYNFSGSPIGDVNGDGKEQTILDAEVVAIQELLGAISESETLNNDNTEIALISFHTDAKLEGVYKPLAADHTANEDLMDYIKKNLRTETSETDIMNTNNGYTNFDSALDRAVEYFENTATDGRRNLLVFLSDGVPNVRGDGDQEGFCADSVEFWNEEVKKQYSCADTGLKPGEKLNFCLSNDPDCVTKNPYQDCIRGPNHCDSNDAAMQYDSELTKLDEMNVARLAIGIGADSVVDKHSALWMIDDNPGKYLGVLPTQVMSTDELSRAVSNLCILNTANPTDSPSSAPSSAPTTSQAPSASPTSIVVPQILQKSFPSQCPEDVIELKKVGTAESLPLDHIKIVSQDKTSVTIELYQTWKTTTVEKIWYNYPQNNAFGDMKCLAEEDVKNGLYETLTLGCTGNMALLYIYALDEMMFSPGDAKVPECCYPAEDDNGPTSEFVLEIACESRCPDEEI